MNGFSESQEMAARMARLESELSEDRRRRYEALKQRQAAAREKAETVLRRRLSAFQAEQGKHPHNPRPEQLANDDTAPRRAREAARLLLAQREVVARLPADQSLDRQKLLGRLYADEVLELADRTDDDAIKRRRQMRERLDRARQVPSRALSPESGKAQVSGMSPATAPLHGSARDQDSPRNSAETEPYWSREESRYTLVVDGEPRAVYYTGRQQVVLLTHGDVRPRRVVVPDSMGGFSLAEQMVGISRVDLVLKEKHRTLLSHRHGLENHAAEFRERVPQDQELRHYLSSAWDFLNGQAKMGGLTSSSSVARKEIANAIRTLQVSGNRWTVATQAHLQAAVEQLHETKDDPLAPFPSLARKECQKALSLIEFNRDLPRGPEPQAGSPVPRQGPRQE